MGQVGTFLHCARCHAWLIDSDHKEYRDGCWWHLHCLNEGYRQLAEAKRRIQIARLVADTPASVLFD